MSKQVVELRKQLHAAKQAHHKNAATMTGAEERESSKAIQALRLTISTAIAAGANPCPFCESTPVGLEHQAKHGFEYEVGCSACQPFQHTDGTWRKVSARGGVLPKHTVELWNEGPDHWTIGKAPAEAKPDALADAIASGLSEDES